MTLAKTLNDLNNTTLDVRDGIAELNDQIATLTRALDNSDTTHSVAAIDSPINVDTLNADIIIRDHLIDTARAKGADDVQIINAATGQDDYAAAASITAAADEIPGVATVATGHDPNDPDTVTVTFADNTVMTAVELRNDRGRVTGATWAIWPDNNAADTRRDPLSTGASPNPFDILEAIKSHAVSITARAA